MRRFGSAALLIAGAAALIASPGLASIETPYGAEGLKLVNAQMVSKLFTAGKKQKVQPHPTDVVFVGYTPSFKSLANPWSIYSGTAAEGFHQPAPGQPDKGTWNWEAPVNGDSLQGWLPLRNVYTSTGGQTRLDSSRPWWAIDIGNNANYVINQDRTAGPAAPGWRTFGVDGVWHRDCGGVCGGVPNVPKPAWMPFGGKFSAWMGLRAHGDDTFLDPLTKNPFNEDVLMFNGVNALSPSGNDKGFPGYGSQMDQMLYRDISFAGKKDPSGVPTGDLTISFKYTTKMSTGFDSAPATRTGWFEGDPLSLAPSNFISSSAAQAGGGAPPIDRFTVYVGAGVEDNDWLGSDGILRPLYDRKHRWFAEVLHWDRDPNSNPQNPQPLFYEEILSVTGDNGAVGAPATFSATIPATTLAPYLQKSNNLRLVFRVKTNRGYDDEGLAYSSGRQGAAVVDDVTYQIGANPVNGGDFHWGTFELANAIDNDPDVSAVNAWKSTGKPPAVYHHVHALSQLKYEDLCGAPGDPNRVCNMDGQVISAGDHDNQEVAGGLDPNTAERERADGMISPTIQLAGPYTGHGQTNTIGLTAAEVDAEEYYIDYEIYTGIFDAPFRGNVWRFGCQSYPAAAKASHGSYPAWGQLRFPDFVLFDPDEQCFRDLEPLMSHCLIRTSNASGIPDSIRIYLGTVQQCFRFGVMLGCSPRNGAYWDNVSLALAQQPPGKLSVDIWNWYQDTFPFNEDPGLPGNKALFDLLTARIRTGHNIAPAESPGFFPPQRPAVPGDSVVIEGCGARLDMVFRILPGPGNYDPVGDGHNGRVRAHLFWDTYRQIPGEFATPNAASLLANAKGGWDPNVWLSARCDTSEVNLFAFQSRGIPGGPPDVFRWMSTYHESDPRYAIFGLAKHICFVQNPAGKVTEIVCDGTVPAYVGVPGVPNPATGWSGQVITTEGTRIIPDGLLTPGSHVEYFFRLQDVKQPGPHFSLIPDTSVVAPQLGEQSMDGHRWQEFSVLPDRWKDPQYLHPVLQKFGRGPACVLVVDAHDRRGNERVWVSVADTIGATEAQKLGAHNGWSAAGGQDVNDPAAFVTSHIGQAGTTWDLYQVKGSESYTTLAGSIGSRLTPVKLQLEGRRSRQGPTPAMLDAYYKMILVLTGDVSRGTLGPYRDRRQDDTGILANWLAAGNPSFQDRAIWIVGDGFVESNAFLGPPQSVLLDQYLGVGLDHPNYRVFAGVLDNVVDLVVFPEWQGKKPEQRRVYGMRNACIWTNDVIRPSKPLLTAATSQYEVKGPPPPGLYGAGVFKDWAPPSPWKALVDGWDIEHLTGRNDVDTRHRSLYFFKTFTNVWAKLCPVAGIPVVPLDVPSFDDGRLVDFLALANNPLRAGDAAVRFGLARPDRVEVRVYDLGGRLVRTLADRHFAAGEHALVWDGLDDDRRPVPRGVYFTRVRHRDGGFEGTRKITVLK